MPLKLTRRLERQNSDSILQLAVSLTSLTKDLADLTCFPPAAALVGVLLLIMETVQANKEGCHRLARRCATMLLNLSDQMTGRWDHAPQALVKNLIKFQETLDSIHMFMKEMALAKWTTRWMKKTSIETTLAMYHEWLDDATQAFQISTLIDIHYALNPVSKADLSAPTLREPQSHVGKPLLVSISDTPQALETLRRPETRMMISPIPDVPFTISPVENDADDSIPLVDFSEDQGFRRYHQSEVVLRGRSRIEDDGWWSGAGEAQVNGQPSLIKRYEGPRARARKQWIRDVKVLQKLYHPNLPQMLGYSVDRAETPFILLSNVQTRSPESLLLGSLHHQGLASCVQNMLRFYSDIVDATHYVQQQMSLSDEQAQDFLENSSFRIDGSNSVIVGLPILNQESTTWRSYRLNESLRMAVLHMLPNRGMVQFQQDSVVAIRDPTWKLTQLTALVCGLLPSGSNPPGLPSQLRSLLDGNDPYTISLSLRQLRMLSIEDNTHGYVWQKGSSIPPHKFHVGDFGYIPTGEDWNTFVVLGNILRDGLAALGVENKTSGVQWCWKDRPMRRSDLESFNLTQENVKCWPVAVPPGEQIDCQIVHQSALTKIQEAWQFLLNNAVSLGRKWNVAPESIILITQEGTSQSFSINDFGRGLQLQYRNNIPPGRAPLFPNQNPVPRIMYLSTSDRMEFEPGWTHSPVISFPRPALESGWTFRVAWKTGFINWAQLHHEDFDEREEGSPQFRVIK
ncbi:hypothetical protein C8R43DRAFT_584498 [Mycena crocata]|nr:hypothetical protein C8R43DRAFT_584498 [Mycena crocata]